MTRNQRGLDAPLRQKALCQPRRLNPTIRKDMTQLALLVQRVMRDKAREILRGRSV